MLFKFKIIITLLLLISSCSGYKLYPNRNPFVKFGISTVGIPIFLNQTPIANVSGPFTREIFLTLSSYNKLKVTSGSCAGLDACLIGIIKSAPELAKTLEIKEVDKSTKLATSATAARADFFIPTSTQVKLILNVSLVKGGSLKDLESIDLTAVDLSKVNSPKLIFSKEIVVETAFSREIFDKFEKNGKRVDGLVVNMTQNLGSTNRTIKNLAKVAAQSFKELLLDAF